MRTRSGSLAAVMARVPSHPAHSGVLCICAANASSRSDPRRCGTRPSTRQKDSNALHCIITGVGNTGLGWRALFINHGGDFNTGVGAGALVLNRGDANTAVGAAALILNDDGSRNTAVGAAAMVHNAGDADGNGSFNGAVGAFALNE